MAEPAKRRLVVLHAGYGCDTGCCGHIIEYTDNGEQVGGFEFSHPYRAYKYTDRAERDAYLKEWAEDMIRDALGEEHVADLDWENCMVSDD